MSALFTGGALLVWSVAVALSTILIIASIGYAQRRPTTRHVVTTASTPDTAGHTTVALGANETRTDANMARTVQRARNSSRLGARTGIT